MARYGEEMGRLEVGGRSVSSWWREVTKIRDGVGEDDGGWFAGRVSKVVGDDTNTLFWCDRWLGDVPFCSRFNRLFELSTNNLSMGADMHRRGWGVDGESWSWRRRLWGWEEEMLEECRNLLHNVFVQSNFSDRWQWDPDSYDGYTVRGAYKIMTTPDFPIVCATDELVWHKQVPLKVSIVA